MISLSVLLAFGTWSWAGDDIVTSASRPAVAGVTTLTTEATKVKFDTLKTQHIVVMAKINGKGPYRLVFDTGAPFTLINNRIAKEAGVIAKDDKSAALMFLGQMPQHKINSFEIGDMTVKDLKTVVMDHPTVALIDKALGPVDGVVGLTFFAKYKMTIDYEAKEMTFVPVDFSPPDILQGMMAVLQGPAKGPRVLAAAGLWGFSAVKPAKDEEAGVTVKQVLAGSPAAAAGLKPGDRLLTLDGRWTDSVADCFQAASFVKPGRAARLEIMRDGKKMELTVKVVPGM